MKAYLVNAGISQTQVRPAEIGGARGAEPLQTWDSCASAILYGAEKDQARRVFEQSYSRSTVGDKPVVTEIKRIVLAEFKEELLTETGNQPLDWARIARGLEEAAAVAPADDFEQGYWVDINQAVPASCAAGDMERLRRELPEDIASGLNWASEKQFFFVVSVLSPPPPPPDPDLEFEPATAQPPAEGEPRFELELDSALAALPELRDKEGAVLVQARNSVVAAWLWRKFAAGTPLAGYELQVGPCVNVVSAEP